MSTSHSLPRFDIFCDSLLSLGAINSPSELQGLVCGKLAGGAKIELAQWSKDAVEFLDLTSTPDEHTDEMLSAVFTATQGQLEEAEFGLQLLLPDDDADLGMRAECLGQWCHGFLTGFGSAGISGDRTLSADVTDAVRDLAAIVQIGTEEDSESSEADFMEVVEYVRIAAITVHAECTMEAPSVKDKPSGSQGSTLH